MMYFQTSVTRMKANKASEMSRRQWSAIGQAQEISIASQSEHNNIITISIANTMQNIPEQMSRSKLSHRWIRTCDIPPKERHDSEVTKDKNNQ